MLEQAPSTPAPKATRGARGKKAGGEADSENTPAQPPPSARVTRSAARRGM
jgi:hypothetical protein